MGLCCGIVLIIIILLFYKLYVALTKVLPIPKLDIDQYWGVGNKSLYKEDPTIQSLDISCKDDVISDLKYHLGRPVNFTEPLEDVGFEYGFNTNKLQQVVSYWRDDYLTRWSERIEFLKKFPHFKTQIQGLQIHFIHVKPWKEALEKKKVLPLLLLHGWPGSVREFYEIIPLLITPNDESDYVFEVIIPSLPGYGWSQGASRKGLSAAHIAVILRNLMLRVGHEKFLIQGGDWGSIIGSDFVTLFPNNVIGYHSNFCVAGSWIKWIIASLRPKWFVPEEYTKFHFPISEKFVYQLTETGYMHIQATKPDTIGATLTANPIGLAAYILEKFSTWTNSEYRKLEDGGLEKRYTMDALLDNIMIYYLTNSITTSQRLYAEQFSKTYQDMKLQGMPTHVPTGVARFAYDITHSMDWQLKGKYRNIIQSTYHLDGGHFAAMEIPNKLYEDFIKFVKKIEL